MYNFLHRFKIFHVLDRNVVTDSFLPFRIFNRFFKKIKLTRTVTYDSHSYKIFLEDGVGAANFIRNYELWLDKIIHKIIDQDSVILDVGANVGQTMLKVLPMYPDFEYYAVEPNVNCIKYLEKLVTINGYKKVKLFQVALSNHNDESELLLRFQDDILATTTKSFRKFTKYSSAQIVKSTIGDDLLTKAYISKLHLLKVDVEGGEADVIEGLNDSIMKFQPYIICEILPMESEDELVKSFRKKSAQKLIDNIHELDYTIFNIETKKKVLMLSDLSTSLESSNYIFIPRKNDFRQFLPLFNV